MVQDVFYVVFVGLTMGTALYVALGPNLIRASFALFFTLSGVAGLYILIGGDFVAMIQLLVYAGGVAVLLTFGAMLTFDVESPEHSNPLFNGFISFLGGTAFFSMVYYVLAETQWPQKSGFSLEPTTKGLGHLLLKEYVLPFEVISFLLLVAMVGAIYFVERGDRK